MCASIRAHEREGVKKYNATLNPDLVSLKAFSEIGKSTYGFVSPIL